MFKELVGDAVDDATAEAIVSKLGSGKGVYVACTWRVTGRRAHGRCVGVWLTVRPIGGLVNRMSALNFICGVALTSDGSVDDKVAGAPGSLCARGVRPAQC